MKTKWVNYGLVRQDILQAFDSLRPSNMGRGAFLARLARSNEGASIALEAFAGYKCTVAADRAAFGRCMEEESVRTMRDFLPKGVNRTGFIAAMIDVAKREGFTCPNDRT